MPSLHTLYIGETLDPAKVVTAAEFTYDMDCRIRRNPTQISDALLTISPNALLHLPWFPVFTHFKSDSWDPLSLRFGSVGDVAGQK